MNKVSKVKIAKYQLVTIGAVLLILKLLGEISTGWIIVLSPFFVLFIFELVFLIIGFISYRTDKRKYHNL